jgi:hypothetical protein
MKELKDDSKDWLKKFIKLRKDLVGVHFTQVKDNELDRKLLEFENNEISTEYKFGLLYVKDGQTTENEYYGNSKYCIPSYTIPSLLTKPSQRN